MTAAHLADFDRARELLSEARRYVTCDLGASERLLCEAMRVVRSLMPGLTGDRLIVNLTVAYQARQVDPDVFRGYVDGVRHELALLRPRTGKAG